jgi:hypothetical protein
MRPCADTKLDSARSLVAFFALAFAFSWAFWIPAAVWGASHGPLADETLLYAGTPGPLMAALVLLYLLGSSAARRDFY